MRTIWIPCLVAAASLLLAPSSSPAQVVNGDFEAGDSLWTPSAPPGWVVDFPLTGGHPGRHAHMRSPFSGSEGRACVVQEVTCGPEDSTATCTVTFDYLLNFIDALEGSGRIRLLVDTEPFYTSPSAGFDGIPWTTVEVDVPCGTHTLGLCLEVDAGNNGWEARFDNVSTDCDLVPVEPATWGKLKSRYR